MRHLDLFSGIGGFALAARWMDWHTIQFVEIDPYCQKVLKKNFPNTPIHGDIKTFDGSKYRGTVDILTGGFPCQKFSLNGKGELDLSEWKEMHRVIGEIQPSIIVVENVYGLLVRKSGMVFETVCTDLEIEGYEVQPFIIPACAKGAPHRRDRVWFVAYSKGERCGKTGFDFVGQKERIARDGGEWVASHSESEGLKQGGIRFWNEEKHTQSDNNFRTRNWDSFPTQSPVCRRNDGIPNRVDRIKGLGNAIVPQVALQIFKAIHETTRTTPFPG